MSRQSHQSHRVREILTIRAVGLEWGIAVDDVEEILPHRPAVPTPLSPPFVEGLVRYRDDVLPVVDLSARFRLPGTAAIRRVRRYGRGSAADTRRQTLVIRISGGLAGLTVDEVIGTRPAEPGRLVTLPPLAASPVVRGCLTDPSGDLLVVLDPRAILETDEPLDLPLPPGWVEPETEAGAGKPAGSARRSASPAPPGAAHGAVPPLAPEPPPSGEAAGASALPAEPPTAPPVEHRAASSPARPAEAARPPATPAAPPAAPPAIPPPSDPDTVVERPGAGPPTAARPAAPPSLPQAAPPAPPAASSAASPSGRPSTRAAEPLAVRPAPPVIEPLAPSVVPAPPAAIPVAERPARPSPPAAGSAAGPGSSAPLQPAAAGPTRPQTPAPPAPSRKQPAAVQPPQARSPAAAPGDLPGARPRVDAPGAPRSRELHLPEPRSGDTRPAAGPRPADARLAVSREAAPPAPAPARPAAPRTPEPEPAEPEPAPGKPPGAAPQTAGSGGPGVPGSVQHHTPVPPPARRPADGLVHAPASPAPLAGRGRVEVRGPEHSGGRLRGAAAMGRAAPGRQRARRLAAAAAVLLVVAGTGWLLADRAGKPAAPQRPAVEAARDSSRPVPAEHTPAAPQPTHPDSSAVLSLEARAGDGGRPDALRPQPAPADPTASGRPPAGGRGDPLVLTLEELGSGGGPTGPSTGAPHRDGAAPAADELLKVEVVRYTVRRGDTLWAIARRFTRNPFRYREIASENDLRNPALIFPGQKLTIRIRRAEPVPGRSQP